MYLLHDVLRHVTDTLHDIKHSRRDTAELHEPMDCSGVWPNLT
jgi:hypothetical protein